MNKGKLYLIPNLLSEESKDATIPIVIKNHIEDINIFIVENIRTARRYIMKISEKKDINKTIFYEYGKHSSLDFQEDFLQNILNGKDVGLLSEAGLPCIADPGTEIVAYAHEFEVDVVPLTGPSSILLALISSGMNGQKFTFNGYIPIDSKERKTKLKQLEKLANKRGQSQIFIETPYRNNQLFQAILQTCRKKTRLCIALNITAKDEYIKTKTIEEWKQSCCIIKKRPCVFIIS